MEIIVVQEQEIEIWTMRHKRRRSCVQIGTNASSLPVLLIQNAEPVVNLTWFPYSKPEYTTKKKWNGLE